MSCGSAAVAYRCVWACFSNPAALCSNGAINYLWFPAAEQCELENFFRNFDGCQWSTARRETEAVLRDLLVASQALDI